MLPVTAQDEGPPVPVEKAAYHWPIFRNDYVMLLRVYMPPGKGSNFHIHSLDQISVLVEAGANAGQVFGKERMRREGRQRAATSASPPTPRSRSRTARPTPPTTPFDNIVIALLKPEPARSRRRRATFPGYRQLFDNERARGWRLQLEPGADRRADHADRAGTARHHRRRRVRRDREGRDGSRPGAAARRFLLAGRRGRRARSATPGRPRSTLVEFELK